MLEAVLSAPQAEKTSELFLVNGGVHHDITSLFLRANTDVREQLIGTIGIIKSAVEELEAAYPDTSPGHVRSSAAFEASDTIYAAYPNLIDDYHFMWFKEELTAHTASQLKQIESELTGIMTGEITLSDAEKQQLSNLSDADMNQYLCSLGLNPNDLAFPLLDVGTGQHAYFAQDVLKVFPSHRVVSTSMHLLNPSSVMSRVLAEQTDRGELVASDGTNMPFEDASFGMVVSLNADPYYVPRDGLLASLREKHRVLKVGATALLCPAVCDYGEHDITQEDVAPLQSEMDVSIRPIPPTGYRFYDRSTRQMLVLNK